MKETMDPMPAEISDKENFANRKLIRPTLPRAENYNNHNAAPTAAGTTRASGAARPRRTHGSWRSWRIVVVAESARWAGRAEERKPTPPEQTNAENFYYQKQMQSRTPMVIVLRDGEEVRGIIEWYDRNCIKVNRENGDANLMIYKPAIKYMFKEGENQR